LDTVLAAIASAKGADQVVVVNDGSTDPRVAEQLDRWAASGDFPGLEIVHHAENAGLGAARNSGVEHARHPWVAFLDADDEYVPQRGQTFAEAWKAFAATPRRGHWFYHPVQEWSPPSAPGRIRKGDAVNAPADLLLRRSPLAPSATVLKTELAKRFPFQTDRRVQGTEDLDLWVRLLFADFRPIRWSELPWTAYRMGTGMSSDLATHAARIRLQRERFVRNGWIPSSVVEAAERELQRQLGRSYHKAGRFHKARKAYQKAGFSLKNSFFKLLVALRIRM
jgi:teichuronic acid biosynthesis glycosyltransferase TuaG